MYEILLVIHSYFRWVILVLWIFSLFFLIQNSFKREISNVFKKFHKFSSISISIQFLFGVILYFLSPLVSQGMENMKEAMKNKEIRYFLVEHWVSMFICLGIFHFLNAKLKKDPHSEKIFTILWSGYLIIALLFIYGIPHLQRPPFR